jgi:homoserine O-acetyltransferase
MDATEQTPAETAPPGEIGLVESHDFHCHEPLSFERGGRLDQFTLRYETYGHLDRARDNAVLVCHALSGDHHCAGYHGVSDRKPGWWNNMIGPGKPIDTDRFFVICSNCIGGCQGSTGPASTNPATGRPYALDFPALTIQDMVAAQARLIDHLGIERLHCVTGGSMGGMQVLQWGIDYPHRAANLLPLATTARQSAQTIAFNEVGRQAIIRDPDWQKGNYPPDAGPDVGLAIARMMAHITYLSDAGLEEKFGRQRRNPKANEFFEVEFEIESYLRHQGESFVNRFDANTYLYFTKALDRFDLYGDDGRLEDAVERIDARTLVIGFSSDWLFPPWQNREIVHALLRCGKDATYAEVEMPLGHDSFLVDAPLLWDLVRAFLG